LHRIKTRAELERLFSTTLKDLGFHAWAHQQCFPHAHSISEPEIVTTFPTQWHAHYASQRYDLIDPVVREGPKQVLPFQWSSLTYGQDLTDRQRDFFTEADDFGVAEGIGIPVLSPTGAHAMVSMVTNTSSKGLNSILNAHASDIHIIALAFHNAIRDFNTDVTNERPAPCLTARELECLIWSANGKSMSDIGCILRISDRTVEFHLKNARDKLGCATTIQAVIRATSLGILNL